MSSALRITASHARRFLLAATGLDEPGRSLPEVLQHLGYVQLDPLNVCGRIHDLILRNRVEGYSPGALLRHIHGEEGERAGFEHYLPGHGVLVAWPLEAHPYIRSHLLQNPGEGSRRVFFADERQLGDRILRELAERGPLLSDQIDHDERGQTVWGTSGRLVKIVLEKLFASGEVAIRRRRDFRRVYDLWERVLPTLAVELLPTPEEVCRFRALATMRQRRLVRLRRQDAELLGGDVQAVEIEGRVRSYCLTGDLRLLDRSASEGPDESSGARTFLLAPLDPVIYDRILTAHVWDFDFTWEVYTPPGLRKRGYYSLPVLKGLEIVGDVEPRADWQKKRLVLRSRRLRRGANTRDATAELATFLGLGCR